MVPAPDEELEEGKPATSLESVAMVVATTSAQNEKLEAVLALTK